MDVSKTIFIAGISKSVCLDKIISKFSSYLDCLEQKDNMLIAIYPEKGYGFITFDSPSSVLRAIKDSKSKKGIIIDNYRLRIEVSRKSVKISQNNKCRRNFEDKKDKKKSNYKPSKSIFSLNQISEYDTEDENETILLKKVN